jgi:hypothetical protein
MIWQAGTVELGHELAAALQAILGTHGRGGRQELVRREAVFCVKRLHGEPAVVAHSIIWVLERWRGRRSNGRLVDVILWGRRRKLPRQVV